MSLQRQEVTESGGYSLGQLQSRELRQDSRGHRVGESKLGNCRAAVYKARFCCHLGSCSLGSLSLRS